MENGNNAARNSSDGDSAVVTFNNQNSILMTMYVRMSGILCLLHDNRIFAFRNGDGTDSAAAEQTLILSLLTTAKFRVMGFLYSGYHLVDNTLFLLIIVMSIVNNGFRIPEHYDMALFAAIGVEGFYDVMLYTHRYWILQRLSIYIGLVLYVAYFVIVGLITCGKPCGWVVDPDHHISITVVWIALGIRFGAFILEELVDITIDIQLHNDLLKLQHERNERRAGNPGIGAGSEDDGGEPPGENGAGNDREELVVENQRREPCWSRVRRYLNVSKAVGMPEGVEYIGSVFAWGQKSVFDKNVWKRTQFSQLVSFSLCFLPTIPAILVFIPLFLLCCTAGLIILLIVSILSMFTRDCRLRNYLRELAHV